MEHLLLWLLENSGFSCLNGSITCMPSQMLQLSHLFLICLVMALSVLLPAAVCRVKEQETLLINISVIENRIWSFVMLQKERCRTLKREQSLVHPSMETLVHSIRGELEFCIGFCISLSGAPALCSCVARNNFSLFLLQSKKKIRLSFDSW